jgi:hypothetical protein
MKEGRKKNGLQFVQTIVAVQASLLSQSGEEGKRIANEVLEETSLDHFLKTNTKKDVPQTICPKCDTETWGAGHCPNCGYLMI